MCQGHPPDFRPHTGGKDWARCFGVNLNGNISDDIHLMEIRRIFVPLFGSENDNITLSTAFAVAKQLKAHADVYFVCEQTSGTLPYLGIGEYLTPDVDEAFKRQVATEAHQAATEARETFQRLCAELEIEEVQEPRGPGTPSTRLQTIVGHAEIILPRLVRLSDMGVFSGPFRHNHLAPNLLEKTLLGSGRPLLFTPWQSIAEGLKKVAIGWNGSAPVARAVLAAQPFLKQAERIDVLYVSDDTPDVAPAQQLVEYLSWHGLQSRDHALQRNETETGQTLLDAACELNADLFVMGAYAHNWYEEIVLGGTTRFVLENTQIPLFVMH